MHRSLTRICRQNISHNISRRGLAAAAVATACMLCASGSASAQGRLDGRYVATLAGVPVGESTWVIDIGEDQFSAVATSMTTGLLRMFAASDGITTSRGTVRGDNLSPTLFVSTARSDNQVEEVKLVMSAGVVKDMLVEPPTVPHSGLVPVMEAHRRSVVDPLSAALIRVRGTDDPVGAEACRRTLPVFNGHLRFDLQLSFNRIETVHPQRGYQGPVAVCTVRFVPIAGHVSDNPAIEYLAAAPDNEMWLAPIAGTRVVVPYRISIPTPLGRGVLEATQFVTTASRAGAASR